MKNLSLKIFSTDPIPNPIHKELLMSTNGTQLAAVPARFSAATGLGLLVMIMLKIMITNSSINQFVISDAVCLLFSLHSADKDTKLRGSLSLSTCQAHAMLLYFGQQLSCLNGLGKKAIKRDSQIFQCIKMNRAFQNISCLAKLQCNKKNVSPPIASRIVSSCWFRLCLLCILF